MADVSTYQIKIELGSLGAVIAELRRINAPRAAEMLVNSLPQTGRGMKMNNVLVLPLKSPVQLERAKRSVKKGDVAWDGQGHALLVVLEDQEYSRPVTILGTVTENLELVDKIVTSIGFTVSRIE